MLRGLIPRCRAALASIGVVIITFLLSASLAEAHERREVGKYVLEVGWRDEPAVAGLPNAVFVEVREKATDKPVEGLTKTLAVDVSFGGLSRSFQPELRPGEEKGTYVADIVPTRPGNYIVRLRGKIEDQTIDERFESGPGRFDAVAPAGSIQHPDSSDLREEVDSLRDALGRVQLLAAAAVILSVTSIAVAVWIRRAR